MTLPTAYWAPASYFDCLTDNDIEIEVCESFEKQTFRNRCLITDLQGRLTRLSIPLKKVEHKQLTRDIQISYQSAWQHQHWMALRSAYEHTPFFLYYADLIRPLYEQPTKWLIDLNDNLTQIALAIIERRIEPNGHIHNPRTLNHTCEWQGLTWTDQHEWQTQTSILDRLMREGA